MTLHQLGITTVPLVCSSPSFLPSTALAATLITLSESARERWLNSQLTRDSETRAILLVTPNNPTGAIYPPELIRDFARLARAHRIALVVDETYREFLPPGTGKPHALFAAEEPEEDWRTYFIQLFSFSKLVPNLLTGRSSQLYTRRSYAIPGHRLGSIICSLPIQIQIHKTMDCLQICPARPAQVAVAWAIEGTRDWREGVTRELVARANVFVSGVGGIDGWAVETVGAYFAYVG